MKTKVKENKKYKAIKALLENREEGLKIISECRKNLKKVSLTVENHEDYMMRVAALIEVCVIALDGQGSFCSKSLSHKTGHESVVLVLEMVIDLLPYDQLFCLDCIVEIINDKSHNSINPSDNQTL